jgi:hypothetical protein
MSGKIMRKTSQIKKKEEFDHRISHPYPVPAEITSKYFIRLTKRRKPKKKRREVKQLRGGGEKEGEVRAGRGGVEPISTTTKLRGILYSFFFFYGSPTLRNYFISSEQIL